MRGDFVRLEARVAVRGAARARGRRTGTPFARVPAAAAPLAGAAAATPAGSAASRRAIISFSTATRCRFCAASLAGKDTWSASDAAQKRHLIALLKEMIAQLEAEPGVVAQPRSGATATRAASNGAPSRRPPRAAATAAKRPRTARTRHLAA